MANPRVKAVIDYFELPNLFGFWIMDPEDVKLWTRATGESWLPHAWLFFAESILVQLDFVEGDDGKRDVSRARYAAYSIDGADFYFRFLGMNDDGKVEGSDTQEAPWFVGDDGRLNVGNDDETWFRYIPAGIGDLVAAGFDRDLIEMIVEDVRAQGNEVIEIFNDKKARELIAEKIRREDEEDGF